MKGSRASLLKSSCAVLEFLRVAGINFGVRVSPYVEYESAKQEVTNKISGGPHMSRADLDALSRRGDKAMQNLKHMIEHYEPR
ncbi:MAG: hypothetical protein ACLFR0_00630 [Alphaproteobacteria bacterium]